MAERWQQWMPFHIDRWRGSPSVNAMHPSAQMGYLNLLCSCWQSPDCSVPNDPVDLATESRLGDELWAMHGHRILRKFSLDGERWRNGVLFGEWEEARRVYEKRKSGAVRTNSSRSASAVPAHTERLADTQTLTGTLTRTLTRTKNQLQPQAAFELPPWIDPEIWSGFEEMRKKERHPMTDKARNILIRKLDGMRANWTPNELLETAILNGWRTVYEPRLNGGSNGTHQPQRRESHNERVYREALALIGETPESVG